MPEVLAGQEPEGASAENPPVLSADDIEARLTQKFDERIKGFQRVIAEKDAAVEAARREAQELRMSGMSEDEKAEVEWQELESQVSKLQAENALLALQSEYPDEMPVFRNLLNASTPKEQLDAIRALRTAQAAAQAASNAQANPAEGEPDIPDVDPNNPSPQKGSSGAPSNGREMNDDLADRILGAFKRMPGR